MTLFSYLIARAAKKNFSEPELLGKLEKKKFDLSKQSALPAGWASHYVIGILMVALFNATWKHLHLKSGVNRVIISSLLGGGLALISWRLFLTALPKRSDDYYKQFYMQLFIAHILFAFTVIATQKAAYGNFH